MSTSASASSFPSDQDWIDKLIAESGTVDDTFEDNFNPVDDSKRWGFLEGYGLVLDLKHGCDKYSVAIDSKTKKPFLIEGDDGENVCLVLKEGKARNLWDFYVHRTYNDERVSYPIRTNNYRYAVVVDILQMIFHDTINQMPVPRLNSSDSEGAYMTYATVPHCQTIRGSFGSVTKVFLKKDPKLTFALKTIRPANVFGGAHRMSTYEISTLYALDHPNVCGIKEVFATKKRSLHIIMEYAELGTLRTRLATNGAFAAAASPFSSDVFAGALMFQMGSAIEYIHSQGLMHRDVKPDNILITSLSPLMLKVADFGLATRDVNPKKFCGSVPYMAPEVAEGKGYDNAVDAYSVGAIFFDILLVMSRDFVKTFYTWKSKRERRDVRVQDLVATRLTLFQDLENFQQLDKQALSLAKDLLQVSPHDRSSVEDALTNPWLLAMNARRSTVNSVVLDPTVVVNHEPSSSTSDLHLRSGPTQRPIRVPSGNLSIEGPSSPLPPQTSKQNHPVVFPSPPAEHAAATKLRKRKDRGQTETQPPRRSDRIRAIKRKSPY